MLTVLLAAALVGAVAVGRVSAPDAAPPGPAGPVGGTPGFAASPDGAAAAAAWFISQIYDARGLGPDRVRVRFGPWVTRGEALDRVVALTTTDFDGHPITAGSITRAAVVGVKQQAYQPGAARISVWSVLLSTNPTTPAAGGPATDGPASTASTPADSAPTGSGSNAGGVVGPSQRWLLDVVSLEWRPGGWRFVAATTLDGPMPPPAPGQAPNVVGAATDLLATAGGGYEAVPDGR